MSRPQRSLAQTARFHRHVLYCFAVLLSLTIGAAAALFSDSALSRFFEAQENTFIRNEQPVQSEIVRLSSRLMSIVDLYEGNWAFHQQERIPLERYRRAISLENGAMVSGSDLTAIPFLLAATPEGIDDPAALGTMLHIVRRLSAAPAFNYRLDITLSGFIYSPDRTFLAAAPLEPPFDSPERIRGRTRAFIDAEVQPIEALLAHRTAETLRGERPIWTLATSPASQEAVAEIVIPIFHGRQRMATLAGRIPRDQFLKYFMRPSRPEGFFVLAGENLQPLDHAALSEKEARLLAAIRAQAPRLRQMTEARTLVRDGLTFIVAQRVDGPGWIAAYAFDWRSIAAAMLGEIAAAWLLCVGALGLLWAGVVYFDRRIARPFERDAKKLVEAEQFNRSIIDTAPVGIAVFDVVEHTLVLENEVAKHLLRSGGSNTGDIVFYELALRKRVDDTFGPPGSGDGHRFFEVHWTAGASERYIGVASSTTRFRGHDAVLFGLVDITERKASESMLIEARREADRANSAKSMFMAMMSHEIRTPLHGAVGHLELLERGALDEAQRERAMLIRRAFDGLLSLINDLLDATKLETHKLTVDPRPVYVNRVVEHCAQQFAPTIIGHGVALHCYTDPALDCLLDADDHRIAQILQNLVSNAAKFTQRGSITLSTALLRHDNERVWIRIEVADTGIGIPSSLQAIIFNPMTQADASISRRFGGTGLGLFLCRNLAELMGGRITLQSEPNVGSLFGVELPLRSHDEAHDGGGPLQGLSVLIATDDTRLRQTWKSRLDSWGAVAFDDAADGKKTPDVRLESHGESEQGPDEVGAPSAGTARAIIEATPLGPLTPAPAGNRLRVSLYSSDALLAALLRVSGHACEPLTSAASPYRLDPSLDVLIAEDDPVNRALIEHQLQALGYLNVRSASDGREALDKWLEREPDITITDVGMPYLGGVELLAAIRERNAHAFVIATTAAGSSDITPSAASLFSHILHKPVLLADLTQALRKAEEARRPRAEAPHAGAVVQPAPPESIDTTLRNMFLDSWPDEYESIKQALERRDVNLGRRRLHRLHGALLAMGLDAEAARCQRLQTTCTEGQWEAAMAEFEALARSLGNIGLQA